MKISPRSIKIIKAVLLVSVLILLWQYVKVIDPAEVKAALMKAGAGFGWMILSTFVAYSLATLGWWYCLSDARKGIPKAGLFVIRHVCETFGMFTPASVAGGDMLKIVLLKPYAINPPTVVASVVVSRLLMITSQVCLLLSAIAWLLFNHKLDSEPWPSHSLAIIAVVCAVLAAGFYGLVKFRRSMWLKYAGTNAKWLRFRSRMMEVWLEISRFYRQYPKELAIAFTLFTSHWIIGSLEFYIILKLLGYPISLVDSLVLDMGVIAVKAAGAFIPGQLGVEELGNKMMLSLIGFASIPLWISVSALRRTRQLFWILVGVLLYSIIIHKKKSTV
ncbi:lysylphosphatidylglycerol synthase domain-containing protein [Dyadobacter arcticus]|uniref:Uncharacterized membrane protein YbhN (UPF0104 family) n=1 Tax=Dyadobacter arcticus TaxID=1078754 RepID=A0ABX0UQ15_9BACT|nr:lysylphosphatidylglycerol synthase domain-containing protein [Dyadobacter arcticus]NIJ54508.1 uncharacterized membrane protein YbhN (UPF0104 family) [Dyadobacter arcticus]